MAPPSKDELFPKLRLETKPPHKNNSSPLSAQLEEARDAVQDDEDGGPVRDGTPPINIPSSGSNRRPTPSTALNDHPFLGSDCLVDESSTSFLDDDRPIRNRGSSISFHPLVTSDSGHRLPLQGADSGDSTPTPHVRERSSSPPDSEQGIYIKPRSQSRHLQDELHQASVPRETLEQRALRPVPRSNEVRKILLQNNDHGLSQDSDFLDQEKLASLTSATTSPSLDEARTPLETVNEYFMTSPVDISTSQQSPSIESWPNRTQSQRTRNFRSERSAGSLRKASRRSSTRSTTNTSVSPASAFLSQWGRTHSTDTTDAPAPQEPDAEGMEIGDHSEYIIGKEIGHGGFSVVKEVHTFEDGVSVTRAVKIVHKTIDGKSEVENEQVQADFEREVEIWRYLKHPYILPLLAVYDTPFATFCIMKLNEGGTLFDLVRTNRRRARLNTGSLTASPELKAKSGDGSGEAPEANAKGMPTRLAKRYIYQLASALRYLHEDLHVVHRDIKLENCLVDMSSPKADIEGGHLLLCDFGLANWSSKDARASPEPFERGDDAMSRSTTSTNIKGSLNYAAPEMINAPCELYSPSVDIWAFGVVAYALLTSELPFRHTFEPRLVMSISKGEYDMEILRNAPATKDAEQDVLDLVHGCLEMDANLRWTVADILDCRWLEGCRELYEEVDCSWT